MLLIRCHSVPSSLCRSLSRDLARSAAGYRVRSGQGPVPSKGASLPAHLASSSHLSTQSSRPSLMLSLPLGFKMESNARMPQVDLRLRFIIIIFPLHTPSSASTLHPTSFRNTELLILVQHCIHPFSYDLWIILFFPHRLRPMVRPSRSDEREQAWTLTRTEEAHLPLVALRPHRSRPNVAFAFSHFRLCYYTLSTRTLPCESPLTRGRVHFRADASEGADLVRSTFVSSVVRQPT